MSAPAPGSNARPKRNARRALEEQNRRVAEYMAAGMTKEDAISRAIEEMRANPTRDWRKGPR
jgi:hypothetical protein